MCIRDSNISVLTHNRLQLTPDFGTSALPDDRYEFEWKVINQDIENEVETVIGNTRNLDYEVALNADVYTLYFTVTEKDTGIYWQKNYTLTVSDTTSEGWMVLCSDEEGLSLIHISISDDQVILKMGNEVVMSLDSAARIEQNTADDGALQTAAGKKLEMCIRDSYCALLSPF